MGSSILVCLYILFKDQERIHHLESENGHFSQIFISNVFKDIEYEISGQIKLIDTTGTEAMWSQVINDPPKLVLFINNLTCEYCISSELKLMKKYLSDLRKEDIIILSGYSNLNSTNLMIKGYQIDYQVYNVVKNGMLPDFLENPTEPVIFLLEENRKAKYIFAPNKSLSSVSVEYYDRLKRYFLRHYETIENNNKGMCFEKLGFDIGNCPVGKDTLLRVKYKNKMDKPLIIQDIRSGCGCTVVKWEREPLAPGESSHIEIHYNSKNRGVFIKQIVIRSNAPNSPIKLSLKGYGND